ncbi:hypothetical protein CHUAL_013179, partial [Chamberlinius hualienensis]
KMSDSGSDSETPGRVITRFMKGARTSSLPLNRTQSVVRRRSSTNMINESESKHPSSGLKSTPVKPDVRLSPSSPVIVRRSTERTRTSPLKSPEQFFIRRQKRQIIPGNIADDGWEDEADGKKAGSTKSPSPKKFIVRRMPRRIRFPSKYINKPTDVASLSSKIQKKIEEDNLDSYSISESENSGTEINVAIRHRSSISSSKRKSSRLSSALKENNDQEIVTSSPVKKVIPVKQLSSSRKRLELSSFHELHSSPTNKLSAKNKSKESARRSPRKSLPSQVPHLQDSQNAGGDSEEQFQNTKSPSKSESRSSRKRSELSSLHELHSSPTKKLSAKKKSLESARRSPRKSLPSQVPHRQDSQNAGSDSEEQFQNRKSLSKSESRSSRKRSELSSSHELHSSKRLPTMNSEFLNLSTLSSVPGSNSFTTVHKSLEHKPSSSRSISSRKVEISSVRRRLPFNISSFGLEADKYLKDKSATVDEVDQIADSNSNHENKSERPLARKILLDSETVVEVNKSLISDLTVSEADDSENLVETSEISIEVPKSGETFLRNTSSLNHKEAKSISRDDDDIAHKAVNFDLSPLSRRPLRNSTEPGAVGEENNNDSSLKTSTLFDGRNGNSGKLFRKLVDSYLSDSESAEDQKSPVKLSSFKKPFVSSESSALRDSSKTISLATKSKTLEKDQPQSGFMSSVKQAWANMKAPVVVLKRLSESFIQRESNRQIASESKDNKGSTYRTTSEADDMVFDFEAYSSSSESSDKASNDLDPGTGTLLQVYRRSGTPSSIDSSLTKSSAVPVNKSTTSKEVTLSGSKSVKQTSTLHTRASRVIPSKESMIKNTYLFDSEVDTGSDVSSHSIKTSTPYLSDKPRSIVDSFRSKIIGIEEDEINSSSLEKTLVNDNDLVRQSATNKTGNRSQRTTVSKRSEETIANSSGLEVEMKRRSREKLQSRESTATKDRSEAAVFEDDFGIQPNQITPIKSIRDSNVDLGSNNRAKLLSESLKVSQVSGLNVTTGVSSNKSKSGKIYRFLSKNISTTRDPETDSRKRKSSNNVDSRAAKKLRLSENRPKVINESRTVKVSKAQSVRQSQKKRSANVKPKSKVEKPFLSRATVKANVEHTIGKRLGPKAVAAFYQQSEKFFKIAKKNLKMLRETKDSGEIVEKDVLEYLVAIGMFEDRNDFIEAVRKFASLEQYH